MRPARLPRTLAHSEDTWCGTCVSVGLNVDMMTSRDGKLSLAGSWVAASLSWLGPGGWEAGGGVGCGRGGVRVGNGCPASPNLGLGGGAALKLLSRAEAGAGDVLGVWAALGEDSGVWNIGLVSSLLCCSTGDGGAAAAVAVAVSASN